MLYALKLPSWSAVLNQLYLMNIIIRRKKNNKKNNNNNNKKTNKQKTKTKKKKKTTTTKTLFKLTFSLPLYKRYVALCYWYKIRWYCVKSFVKMVFKRIQLVILLWNDIFHSLIAHRRKELKYWSCCLYIIALKLEKQVAVRRNSFDR